MTAAASGASGALLLLLLVLLLLLLVLLLLALLLVLLLLLLLLALMLLALLLLLPHLGCHKNILLTLNHFVKALLHMDHLVLKFRLVATSSDWAAILDLYQQLLMVCRRCGVFGTSGAEPGPQAEEAGLLRFGSDRQAQRGHGRSGDGG